jgi:hypothetical protein
MFDPAIIRSFLFNTLPLRVFHARWTVFQQPSIPLTAIDQSSTITRQRFDDFFNVVQRSFDNRWIRIKSNVAHHAADVLDRQGHGSGIC